MKVRRRVFLLFAVWMLLLVAVLSFLSYLDAALSSSPASHTIISVGWAGYIVSSPFNEQHQVVAISATWIVPKINASAGNGCSSAWIGIGGQIDKTLIQVGTEHNLQNGKENYAAWYEMLPGYAIKIENFTIVPYHRIVASLMLVDNESDIWNIQLSDTSNGQRFNRNFAYKSELSSGEWIVERALINGQISNLADFGTITFSDCKATLDQESRVIGNYSYSTVHMTNQQLTTLAETQPLNADGSSFQVKYLTSN